MILRNKSLFTILLLLVLEFIVACRHKDYQKDNLAPSDTISFDGLFFANESIVIKANDSLIFEMLVDSTRRFQKIYREFVVGKSDTVNLLVQTFINGVKIIDTSFTIPPEIYVDNLGGSTCYPAYISDDSLKKMVQPQLGYTSIDSCKRYITLMPDSIMYRYPTY